MPRNGHLQDIFYEAREPGCSPLLGPQAHSQRHHPFSLPGINFSLEDNPAKEKQGDFVGPLMGMNWTTGGEYRNAPSQTS